jgi:drug/metabolite transporter (DMT)-like permease
MNQTQSDDVGGTWEMLASVVLFSANALLIRAASLQSTEIDGWMAILFRGVIGVLLLQFFFGRSGKLSWRRIFTNRLMLGRGLLGGFATILFYLTITELGPARATVLNLTYPMFAAVIAACWLKEKVSVATRWWLLIALLGLLIFLGVGGLGQAPSFYDFIALLGALAAGWVVVIIRKLRNEEHPATIYGALVICTVFLGLPSVGKLPELPPIAWVILTIAGCLAMLGQLKMTSAYQRMSVARGASLQMALPVFTAAGAYVFFGESLELYELIGAIITLFAIWRLSTGKTKTPAIGD